MAAATFAKLASRFVTTMNTDGTASVKGACFDGCHMHAGPVELKMPRVGEQETATEPLDRETTVCLIMEIVIEEEVRRCQKWEQGFLESSAAAECLRCCLPGSLVGLFLSLESLEGISTTFLIALRGCPPGRPISMQSDWV